jgi:hypothetical protein
MKASAIVAVLLLFAGAVMAQPATSSGGTAGATCKTQAAGKKLHGAALTSSVKSCCRQQAAAQKLHGAAETSFRKSCESAGLAT